MKEKDLKRNLDNLIIDGLIKEAEQDNADFEAAIRKMSDEEFEEFIYRHTYKGASGVSSTSVRAEASYSFEHEPELQEASRRQPELCECLEGFAGAPAPSAKKSKWQVFRPWIGSAVAAAAVVLIVLIPSIIAMNSKLCDSALYASSAYITSSRSATEIDGLTEDQLKGKLPELEKRYKDCIKEDGKFAYYTDDLKDAGWDLTLAYLKLHKKGDAVKVLKVLSAQFNGTPFGDHCQKMIDQL